MTAVAQGAPTVVSRPAGESLVLKQFCFVKQSGDTFVACSAATDLPTGVLQNKPANGIPAEVVVIGPTKVVADIAITAGALIGTSADGQADPKIAGDTSDYVAGKALEAATGAGQIIEAIVNCATPYLIAT